MKRYLLIPVIVAAAGYALYKTNAFHPGDKPFYGPDSVEPKKSVLNGKTIIFLGSSVTYGRNGISFVEYLEREYGIKAYKEALSGTTLADVTKYGRKSYVERIRSIDKEINADLFVCQLSTNDASTGQPLGKISDSYEPEDFDTKTIAGAIEYIIAYASRTWKVPVLFYTNTRYDSPAYEKMVELLYQIREKWQIGIIDLYNDLNMDDLYKGMYRLYMVDKIHPSLCGYRDWWTPFIAKKLEDSIKGE